MCQKVRMGLLLYLRSWVAVTACSLTMISGAQYEVGASFGLYHDALQGRRSEGYSYAEFDDLPVISLVASIHYRERCSSRTDLGVELQFVRKSFSVLAREGGLAGSSGIDADVSLYTISHYRSTQRCAAIFSQDDPRRSLRSRSYGTTSKEK